MRFQLVDQILSLEPGRCIHGVKTMPVDEELFLDHFPGFPVVPGVLLVEMMGQVAAKCLHAEGGDRGVAMLCRISNATFRDWVRPGQLIDIFADIANSRPKFATANCRITVDGQPRASADVFFGFVSRDRFSKDYCDPVLEGFLRHNG